MSDPVPFRPYTEGTQPHYDTPEYLGTRKRHPKQRLHPMPQTITETTGPSFSPRPVISSKKHLWNRTGFERFEA